MRGGGARGCSRVPGRPACQLQAHSRKRKPLPHHPLGPVRAQVSLRGASCEEKDQVLLFATTFIGKPRSGPELPTGAPSVAALCLELSICHLRTACQAQAGTQGLEAAQSSRLVPRKWPFLRTAGQQAQTLPQRGSSPSQDRLSKWFGEAEARGKQTPSSGENDKGWKLGQLLKKEKKPEAV